MMWGPVSALAAEDALQDVPVVVADGGLLRLGSRSGRGLVLGGGGGGALPPDCPICCDRFCAMFITCAMASGSESRVFSFSSHSLIVTPSRGFYFFALSLMRLIMAMPSGLFIRFESIVANSFVLPAAAFCAA